MMEERHYHPLFARTNPRPTQEPLTSLWVVWIVPSAEFQFHASAVVSKLSWDRDWPPTIRFACSCLSSPLPPVKSSFTISGLLFAWTFINRKRALVWRVTNLMQPIAYQDTEGSDCMHFELLGNCDRAVDLFLFFSFSPLPRLSLLWLESGQTAFHCVHMLCAYTGTQKYVCFSSWAQCCSLFFFIWLSPPFKMSPPWPFAEPSLCIER